MRAAAAVLLLTLAAQGQQNQPGGEPKALKNEGSSPGANQNTSTQTPSQPSPTQAPSPPPSPPAPSPGDTPCITANVPPTEPKDSFSQLALFLFASGLGLFIALLGWSDQIRGIDKDTKELEDRFLKKTRMKKHDFLKVTKSESPYDQFVALTQNVSAGKIKSEEDAQVLSDFAIELRSQWAAIERLSTLKYYLTIALTIGLFVAGVLSLFTTPAHRTPLYVVSVRSEMALVVVPVMLIGLLLVIIIYGSRQEKALRSLLNSISDKVN
jgi:hypothetical protein